MYNYDVEEDTDLEEDDIIIDRETEEAIGKKLYQPVYSVDPKRSELSNTSGSRRLSPGMNEIQTHTTTARKNSIAPFKMRKFDGPPIGAGNASKIFRTGPGRKSGTVYGFSRAPLSDEDDGERIYSIKDIISPDLRSVSKARRARSISKNYKSS